MVVKDPIMISEPCVQRLVIGPYLETGMGPQGLKLAQGLELPTPALPAGFLLCMQYITWAFGAVAAYRLWENYMWLSVVVAVLALSYAVHRDESMEHAATGMYSRATGTRLMLTFMIVAAILVFSLFV